MQVLTLGVDRTIGSATVVSAFVDGVALADLTMQFEAAHSYSPAGGYGGLIPSQFDFGDLTGYFLGTAQDQFPEPGRAYLLGCGECGEVGCWPLEVGIVLSGDTVTWTDFGQPHRPERDYTAFGPFTFDKKQYQAAVLSAVQALSAHSD